MSIPMAIADLEHALRERGPAAYIITVDEGGRPHVVQVCVEWGREGLVAEIGTRTARFAGQRPHVSLLYPSKDSTDYSLIVDGSAIVVAMPGKARLTLSPTRAVLHRPVPALDTSPSACGADCVPLALPSQR